MNVARSIEQVVGRKLVLELPESFENRQVEVIVQTVEGEPTAKRRPHPNIVGKMTIHGDIFDSVPLADWDLLR